MLRKSKKFLRETAPSVLRRFCPDHRVEHLTDIFVEDLARAGVRAVLLDVDNTLLPWKGLRIPDQTKEWVAALKAAGIKICLVSNTRNLPRLRAIAESLGVSYVRGRMKPAKEGFENALRELKCSPSETVMIGDQMFTDVWGGNRMGLKTIWVQPMHPREFVGTKLSRIVERIIAKFLQRACSK
jgi:HAD superfamily phosphatase (TIGR01668 family)